MMKQSMKTCLSSALLIGAVILVTGCSKSGDTETQSKAESLPASLFLAQAPAGVQSIASVKAAAQEGDPVVIKAVIGGRKQSFVAKRAVMTVVDAALDNPCLGGDDHCPTPWDYCCTPSEQLLSQMATVQILGPDKRPLSVDLPTVDHLSPLSTLVIQGTVGPRPDKATLVIHATGIFVDSTQG